MIEFVELIIFIFVFIFISFIVNLIYTKIRFKSNSKLLNMEEYLPSEEIQTLKQVFYLSMMTLFLINLIYAISFPSNEIYYFVLFDMILSLVAIVYIFNKDKSALYLIFGLIPYGTFSFFTENPDNYIFLILELVHILTLAYMIKYFYDSFKKFTSLHSLGHTILLLYGIIFFSFIWTSFVENVSLLDSFAMVSNAFTSNGYAILGSTIPGKLNSLFLVWSGYILSGVGTATLTVAILNRQYEKRLDKLEKMIHDLHDKK